MPILGSNGPRNSRNLILSEIKGFRIFLPCVKAKLPKVDFWTFYWKCYFCNFASAHSRKILNPKISLKIKFLEFLSQCHLKMSRPNNFFRAKLANLGYFWPFLMEASIKYFDFNGFQPVIVWRIRGTRSHITDNSFLLTMSEDICGTYFKINDLKVSQLI